jgi:hypothetical protein
VKVSELTTAEFQQARVCNDFTYITEIPGLKRGAANLQTIIQM